MASLLNPLIKALTPLTSRLRTDVTAKKVPAGRSIWTKDALTDAVMAKHLNGGPARGQGFILPGESETMVCTLDLDSHKGEVPWDKMTAVAGELVDTLEMIGMRPQVFSSSGGNGIHIILIWNTKQDAYSVRQFMFDVLASVGYCDGTEGVAKGQIEVFPKQDRVDIGAFGNQCILPLAGKSVPLEPTLGYAKMDKDHALTLEWVGSPNVPVLVRPDAGVAGGSVSMEELTAALAAIPNSGEQELDYDRWRNVVFGIHHATGGSDEGLALAHEFSARSSKYDKTFVEQRTWPYIKSAGRDKTITGNTVLALAREHGWQGTPEVFGAVVHDVAAVAESVPKFKRDKNGKIEACVVNCLEAVRRPSFSGIEIRLDRFKDTIMYAKAGSDQWAIFSDSDYTGLREVLERKGFKPIGRELIRDVVGKVAGDNAFDSAIEWLSQQKWDGTARVETFLTRYFGVTDSAYARGLSRYIWTALAGRVLVPGIKADMVPIFIGTQGTKKSTAVAALSPHEDFFAEFNLADRDADMSRKMRGRLVGEIGELRGLHSKDLESIKSFITQRHEKWTPKFKEFESTFPRRLVFFGTTNQEEFLSDPTGNRRFCPVRTPNIDVEAITQDCNQLWAEGAVLFTAAGVDYHDAEILAENAHFEHQISDPWADIVIEWLDRVDPISGDIPRTRNFLHTSDVLRECLGLDPKNIAKVQEMRIGAVFRQIGYVRKKLRDGKNTRNCFVPPVPTE